MDRLNVLGRRCFGALRIRDDHGFTTVGMAVSILVSLALVFTTSQVYRVNSASAEIQEIADIAALAAENEVAEYLIVARTCDAIVLSMTLLGLTSCGVGIVALCVPSAAGFGKQLIDFGQKSFDARDRFSQSAAEGLNKYQQLLPFLMMASASKAASANGGSSSGSYFAVAVPVPFEGKELASCEGDASDTLVLSVEAEAEGLASNAELAEAAAVQANEAKQRAFEADCGANPGRCMYERAARLAGLSSARNPLYQSADAWSFSVALERARDYYAARYAAEAPASQSVEEQSNSAIRKAFYGFAMDQLADAYVNEGDGRFSADIPVLPSNTEEMRVTRLFYDALWPVHEADGASVMHAWEGCPGIQGSTTRGSLSQAEVGSYAVCSVCGFSASAVGNVASASSNISNGFEYHFRIVAIAAQEYEEAYAEVTPLLTSARESLSRLMEKVAGVLDGLEDVRIKPVPPGSKGVVAIVVSTSAQNLDGGLGSSLIGQTAELGARVAVSGATMIEESSGEGQSVLSSLLDGFVEEGSAGSAAGRALLRGWSALLASYGEGEMTLVSAVEEVIDSVPLATASGLGDWAKKALDSTIAEAGLQPADLDALKPVVVSTAYVVEGDEGAFSRTYSSMKSAAGQTVSSSADSVSVLVGLLQSFLSDQVDVLEEGVEVARVELPWEGSDVSVRIALPESLGERARAAVSDCMGAIGSAYVGFAEERVWR